MEIFEDIGTKMDISVQHEKSSLWKMLLTNTFILPTMLFKNNQNSYGKYEVGNKLNYKEFQKHFSFHCPDLNIDFYNIYSQIRKLSIDINLIYLSRAAIEEEKIDSQGNRKQPQKFLLSNNDRIIDTRSESRQQFTKIKLKIQEKDAENFHPTSKR